MSMGRVDVDSRMCKGCELCIAACTFGVIQLSAADTVNEYSLRYVVAEHPEKCTGCGVCALMCPDSAITVWRFVKAS